MKPQQPPLPHCFPPGAGGGLGTQPQPSLPHPSLWDDEVSCQPSNRARGEWGLPLFSAALKAPWRWLEGPRVVGETWAPTSHPRKQFCWQKGAVRTLSCCGQEWPEVSWGQVGTQCPLLAGPGCFPHPPSVGMSYLGQMGASVGREASGERGPPMVAPLPGCCHPWRRHCGHRLSPGVCIQARKGDVPRVLCCLSQSFTQSWTSTLRSHTEFQWPPWW